MQIKLFKNLFFFTFFLTNFLFSVDYETEIQPIFDANCMQCHEGPYSGGLQLGTYEQLMAGGNRQK